MTISICDLSYIRLKTSYKYLTVRLPFSREKKRVWPWRDLCPLLYSCKNKFKLLDGAVTVLEREKTCLVLARKACSANRGVF